MLTKYPRVTIIIPAHKADGFIPEAVDSIRQQTYPHIETIISPDDGERYASLRQQFLSPQIRILKPDGTKTGPAASRNRALNFASGDYITFIDADDYIDHDYVQKLIDIAMVDGAAIGKTDYVSWDRSEIVRTPPFHDGVLTLSGFAQLLCSIRILTHRSQAALFYDGFAEDVLHDAFHLAKFGSIRIADTLYHARIRETSICATEAESDIAQRYKDRIDQINLRPAEVGLFQLHHADRLEIADLFKFRLFVSNHFAKQGTGGYHEFVRNQEAALWDEFSAISKRLWATDVGPRLAS